MGLVEDNAVNNAVVVTGNKLVQHMSRVVKMKSRPAVCRIRIGKSICMPWIQGRCEGIHAAPVTGDAIDDVPRGNGVVVPCGINGSIDKDWQVSLVYVEMALQNRVDVIRLE